jgi:hypothetical protein
MIELKYKNHTSLVKNQANEITLDEYIKVLKVQKIEEEFEFDHFINIFKILGASDDILDNITQKALGEAIKAFNMADVNKDFIKEIEIDGYTYSSERFFDEDEFSMPAKKYAKIEKKVKQDNYDWMLDLVANIFERTDLTSNEHNDETHIKYKKELFKNVTIDKFIPYFAKFTQDTIETYQIIVNKEENELG